jgi:ABC-type transport system involved in multi-copper enzyme maturation permease subunit
MWCDTRAEAMIQVRRPAHWLLLAIAMALTLTFAYVIPYAGLKTAEGARAQALAPLLTDRFAGSALGGLPAFIGALALIFGVLVVGSDYAWQTWKTVLIQQPSRIRVYAGKVAVVVAGTLLLMLALFAVAAASSLAVTGVEDAAAAWPPVTEILRDLGAGWVITTMWGMAGVLLAVGLRSVALPIGIGLVWMLAVQNLISGLAAPLLDWVDALQQWLPGGAAGSLVGSLGARSDTPGVAELSSPLQAVLVVAGYLVACAVAAGWLLRHRDVVEGA